MSALHTEATSSIVVTSRDHIDRLDQHPYSDFPREGVVAIQVANGDNPSNLCLIQMYNGDCGNWHFRAYDADGRLETTLGDPCHPGPIIESYISRWGLQLPALDN